MACVKILQGTPTWLTFIAVDSGTGDPRPGITFNQIDVAFKKSTDTSFILKPLVGPPTDFRESGNGVYEILFETSELSVLGTFLYVINSNGALPAPTLRQFIGQAYVESSSVFTPGSISLNTNVLTGNLIDLRGNPLVGEAISARVVAMPTIQGASPNIGGIGVDIISAKTDSVGFFALELVQGALVDIVIPVINYRRTLTVPSNSSDVLFSIP